MRTLFFAAIAILSPVLMFIFRRDANRWTDCSAEDVPIVDELAEKVARFDEYKHWINEVERKFVRDE